MDVVHTLTIDSLLDELHAHPVNTNQFFVDFRDRFLTTLQLHVFVKQYHFFCHRFVKVLEGLLYHTPLEALDMRIELTKTLYSELGSGSTEHAHIRHLERFAGRIGVGQSDLIRTVPIPEVQQYLDLLDRLFVQSDFRKALGAELAVETTAISEFRFFLPGLLKYPNFTANDLTFFSMHLQEETHHGDWLTDAVRQTTKSHEDLELVAAGGRETADAWNAFWQGMHRAVFDELKV